MNPIKLGFLIGSTIALLILGVCNAKAADGWFVSPTAAVVFPNSAGIVYHGMSGTVDYKSGYTTGLSAGGYVGPFKLYLTYDYTSYQDKGFTIQTPIGPQYQSDHSNYNGQTIMVNADYILPWTCFGIRPQFGAGMGQTFDGGDNTSIEVRAGVSRALWKSWHTTLSYSYRWTQGNITSGHVSVEEADQQRITLSIGRSF